MPVWGLQIILAAIPLIKTLVEKLIPDMATKKREFKTKKKVMKKLIDVHAMTIDEIARLKDVRKFS